MRKKTTKTSVRKQPTPKQRALIYKKTGGTCHVCGDRVGRVWHADHVVPHYRGGDSTIENFLPICSVCNRLRWAHRPRTIRKILRLGIYARREMKNQTELGLALKSLYRKRIKSAEERRIK